MYNMDQYHKFINRQQLKPREPRLAIGQHDPIKAINWVIDQTPDHVFFDLETTGLNYADPNQVITTVGLASPDWVVGIDLMYVPFGQQQLLWDWLRGQSIGGFNLGFDLGWPWRTPHGDTRVHPGVQDVDIFSDTLLWYRLLATESHENQTYSLETLVDKVLGWPAEHQQKSWLNSVLNKYNLPKNEMYKLATLEPAKYTEYCALDAEASYQAHQVFQDVLAEYGFNGLNDYFREILVPKIRRNIDQTCRGIKIDRPKLKRNLDWVHQRLAVLEAAMLNDPLMKDYVDKWVTAKVESQYRLKPNVKKIWAKKADEPWNDPETWRLQLTEPAKVDKLPAWTREYAGKFWRPEVQFSITGKNKQWPRFNVSSAKEMKKFIYEYLLDNNYDIWYKNPEKPNWGGLVTVRYGGDEYQVDLTKGGGLPTGGDILMIFGEFGKLLREYKALMKLEGDFLSKYYASSARSGYVHAQGKILGTVTGRMAGGSET